MENNKNNQTQELINISQSFDSESYIQNIKTSIKEGLVNPLGIYTILKRMNKISEVIFKDTEINEIVLNEADKHLSGNQKTFDLYSARICKMPTYTWYDFSGCNHPQLEKLYEIQKEVALRIKLLEDELKELIVPEKTQIGLGIVNDTKEYINKEMPAFGYVESDDKGLISTIKSPKKIQKIGLKFMKI